MKKQKTPQRNSKMDELKSKAVSFLQKASAFTSRNKRKLVVTLVTATLLVVANSIQKERNATYELSLFASTIGGPMPLQNLTVKGVSHEADGSVCFREELQSRSKGCVKVDLYILRRSE